MKHYDIFISYKRKSLATANNLYYRLTTRGYSTFFDLEEMRKDNFNVQLLNYIENSKDVFVIIEEGSLDACKSCKWENDWFCKEIAHALKTKRNIIPILIGNYKMPSQEFFPEELKELALKNAPEFSFSFFEEYLNKLVEKGYITSKAQTYNQTTSIFKFYSNESCQIYKEGKLVCSLVGMSDEPYYLPVPRKGDYRFKAINTDTLESQIINESIDSVEEKSIEVKWKKGLAIKNPFRYKRKGCSITICILLLLAVVFIPFNLCRTSYDVISDGSSIQSSSYPSSTDTVCTPVDLGLASGTLWGDRNLGTNNVLGEGLLYAWASIVPIKQQPSPVEIDNKIISGTSYDAASIVLGSKWSLPTESQFNELVASCNWEWQNIDGVNGYLVIGPNGNSIFLPAVGCVLGSGIKYYGQFGYYWTGEAHPTNSSYAKELLIGINQINVESGRKNVGRSIRPVFVK